MFPILKVNIILAFCLISIALPAQDSINSLLQQKMDSLETEMQTVFSKEIEEINEKVNSGQSQQDHRIDSLMNRNRELAEKMNELSMQGKDLEYQFEEILLRIKASEKASHNSRQKLRRWLYLSNSILFLMLVAAVVLAFFIYRKLKSSTREHLEFLEVNLKSEIQQSGKRLRKKSKEDIKKVQSKMIRDLKSRIKKRRGKGW